MKRIICIFSVLLLCLFGIGCDRSKDPMTDKEEKVPKNDKEIVSSCRVPKIISDTSWLNYDEDCTEAISFNSELDFSYFCSCGEPVGDYDLYDRYAYIEEEGIIRLSGEDMPDEDVELIYYDECYLALSFRDTGIRIFVDEDLVFKDIAPMENMDVYADEGWMYTCILGYGDDKLKIAPYGYDGDARGEFEEYITDIAVTDDVKFCNTETVVENGNAETNTEELSQEDYEYIGEFFTGAFIHLNEDGIIDNVNFYGKTEVWN